jgi:IclR family acetate operon transcriptional repressor
MERLAQIGGPARGVQSIARALTLLDVVAAHGELMLGEVAAAAGLPPSTAHRLLAALIDSGYVIQDRRMGHYRVSHKVLDLAHGLRLWTARPVAVVHPHLEAIRDATRETANFAVLEQLTVVYVDQAESPNAVGMFTRIGRRAHAHAAATGKAMLARLPRSSLEPLAASEPFPRLTPHTITTASGLRAELEGIRRRGYALDLEEYEEGVACIAVPIVDSSGEVHGAISVSAPAPRLRRLERDEVAELLAGHAAACAAELAARDAPAAAGVSARTYQ